MRSLALTLTVFGIFMATSFANAEQPNFEESSVKRTKQCAIQNMVDPGMIAFHGDPLKVVLMERFTVKMDQIVGPSWLDSECFAIEAKIAQGATKDQLASGLCSGY
ncbi:MAG TPA: TIGR03435 family protein [Bryobacteraceae bacterium]|nr:TIGR03435 family protein [Bryobacteraceae bacterium]